MTPPTEAALLHAFAASAAEAGMDYALLGYAWEQEC